MKKSVMCFSVMDQGETWKLQGYHGLASCNQTVFFWRNLGGLVISSEASSINEQSAYFTYFTSLSEVSYKVR